MYFNHHVCLNFRENNTISVWNDGRGIPVEMHKEQKMFVPSLIFGQLLTSSNYNDSEKKVTGGRNGYGAKLCNIFSTKFVVETCSSDSGKRFKQVYLHILCRMILSHISTSFLRKLLYIICITCKFLKRVPLINIGRMNHVYLRHPRSIVNQ